MYYLEFEEVKEEEVAEVPLNYTIKDQQRLSIQ